MIACVDGLGQCSPKRLKMELKKKNKEIVNIKNELSLERDRVYHIERFYKEKERKEIDVLKKDMEKKREEMIKKEAILRVRTEEEERAKMREHAVNMQ